MGLDRLERSPGFISLGCFYGFVIIKPGLRVFVPSWFDFWLKRSVYKIRRFAMVKLHFFKIKAVFRKSPKNAKPGLPRFWGSNSTQLV